MNCLCITIKYRWKGENVATTEVADHLLMVDCVEEANVYGVKVPGNNCIIITHFRAIGHAHLVMRS